MTIITFFSWDINSRKNDYHFDQRIKHLQQQELLNYDRIVADMSVYNQKIEEDIISEVQKALELEDDILINSNECYQKRPELYQYID